jgi:hypothetical protein
MRYLTAIELANWMALYVAAGSCCVIAMALSCATTMVEVVLRARLVQRHSFGPPSCLSRKYGGAGKSCT